MRSLVDYSTVCYEKTHNCPECGGKLGLREKKGNGQTFVCRKCANEYWLAFGTGELENKGKSKAFVSHQSKIVNALL